MDQLQSGLEQCSLNPFPLMRLSNELITDILEALADGSVRGKQDLIALSKTCSRARGLAKRFIFRDVALLTREGPPWHTQPMYARLALHHIRNGMPPARPTKASPNLQAIFFHPLPDFLRHIQTLAVHEFWNPNRDSSGGDPDWIARGLSRLLLKPGKLRELEIDTRYPLAQRVEKILQDKAARFIHLKKLTLSVEFRFLLRLAPNLTHVSNSTREGYGKWDKWNMVEYTTAELNEMMKLLKPLQGLRHLALNVSDCNGMYAQFLHVKLPTLTLETFNITGTRQICPQNRASSCSIPMGLIFELLASQPSLRKMSISGGSIVATTFPERVGWSSDCMFHGAWLPAAVIATRIAWIQEISFGDHANFVVKHDVGEGKVVLQENSTTTSRDGPVFEELEVKIFTARDPGWAGHENESAWIAWDSDDMQTAKPLYVVVNADYEWFDYIE